MHLTASMKPRAKRATVHKDEGSPTFCWHCQSVLRQVKDRPGVYYFVLARDEIGHEHRLHAQCLADAKKDHQLTVL